MSGTAVFDENSQQQTTTCQIIFVLFVFAFALGGWQLDRRIVIFHLAFKNFHVSKMNVEKLRQSSQFRLLSIINAIAPEIPKDLVIDELCMKQLDLIAGATLLRWNIYAYLLRSLQIINWMILFQ